MGLHRDGDEETFAAPVVSLSLGDSAVFRIGGAERRDPTTSLRLHSGDVVVLAGPSRLAHHGIHRGPGGSRRLLDRTGWEGGGGAGEHKAEKQSLMPIPYAGFWLKKNNRSKTHNT